MTIPQSDWIWSGFAGHYICAKDCRFRMTTYVGDFLISTVGQMWRGDEMVEVGWNRKFETYVFNLGDGVCSAEECNCGLREPKDFMEIDSLPANDAKTARENHMTLCHKYAGMEPKS